MPIKIEYYSGQKIGKCIYLHEVPRKSKYRRRALFKCYCGNKFEAIITQVKNGNTTSCGCRQREIQKYGSITHNLSKHPLFHIWYGIKKRCYNIKEGAYHNYGGRGIKMCDEWLNDFKSFYDHVTSLPHYREPGMTIDRIDNDGNYEPGNIRWADRHIQSINSRKHKNNKSGFVGVGFHKLTNKWAAHIGVNGNQFHLGIYDNLEDAVKARNQYIIDNNLTEYPIQKIH